MPVNCTWSNRNSSGAAQPTAQGTPWLVEIDPATGDAEEMEATDAFAGYSDASGPYDGPAGSSAVYGFADLTPESRGLLELGAAPTVVFENDDANPNWHAWVDGAWLLA